ncbi:MAG: oligosaccharide flippase family protein [Luteitalea sp.]|nr:oligosaccharide flippase family protein [Luteitalea sp.]
MKPPAAAGWLISGLVHRSRERILRSVLGTRLARGTLWSLVGSLAARTLALVSSVIVARLLGRTGFGELGVVQSTIGTFQVFAGFELGVTATKYVAEFKVRDPEKAGRIVGLSTVVAWATGAVVGAVMLGAAPVLAASTLSAPHLTGILRISAVSLLLGAVSGAQIGALSGFEAFRRIAWINLVTGIVSLPFMVAGALLAGLTGAVWGAVLTLATNVIVGHAALRGERRLHRVPVRYLGSRREWRVLFGFSLPAVLSGLLVVPVNWVCQAILVNQPGGFDEMGLFNAANQWRMAILFLPGVLSGVVTPAFAGLARPEDHHRYRRLLWYNMGFNVAASIAIALPVSLLSPFIMSGYGPSFVSGYPVLIVLCFTTVIYSGMSVIGSAIVGRGLMWWGVAQNAIWATVMIAATWQLRHQGAIGLAVATLLAYLVHLLSSAFLYGKIIGKPGDTDPSATVVSSR